MVHCVLHIYIEIPRCMDPLCGKMCHMFQWQ